MPCPMGQGIFLYVQVITFKLPAHQTTGNGIQNIRLAHGGRIRLIWQKWISNNPVPCRLIYALLPQFLWKNNCAARNPTAPVPEWTTHDSRRVYFHDGKWIDFGAELGRRKAYRFNFSDLGVIPGGKPCLQLR